MAINWYPGHMHKARKEMIDKLPNVDLLIEVLDARIPYSSQNPVINSLLTVNGNTKPCIKVLSKSDLADPKTTAAWKDHLEKTHNVKAIPLTSSKPAQTQQLLKLCHSMFPNRAAKREQIHVMIAGIPNVGKSTLINTLAGKTIAKTGNEPAVTKGQQRIRLDDIIVLSDTPGVLWPKIENEHSGYRLATTGAIKNTAMEYEDVAFYAATFLAEKYPEQLKGRYDLEELPNHPLEILEAIGRSRGCIRSGGQVDLNKVSVIFLNELRAGTIGNFTFETPEMIAIEEVEVVKLTEKKATEKEEKRTARKKRRKRNS